MSLSVPASAATYTVDSWDELARGYDGVCDTYLSGGDCTLRDAIAQANANPGSDTIILGPISEPGFSGTIEVGRTGTAEVLNVTGDLDAWDTLSGTTLTITTASGFPVVVHTSNSMERVLHSISSSGAKHAVMLDLSNFGIEGGVETNAPGGCVWAQEAHLTLTNMSIVDCKAGRSTYTAGAAGGGAVAAQGGFNAMACSFERNFTTHADGGALFIEGDLTMDASVLLDNAVLGQGVGGGLAWYGTSNTADVTGCSIEGNDTQTHGGGGIYLRDVSGAAHILSSTLIDNHAAGYGGGAWAACDTLSFDGVEIANNTAVRGGGAYIIPGSPASVPLMDGSSVVENETTTEGGGLFIHTATGMSSGEHIIRNSTIGANRCGMGGGTMTPGCGVWLGAGALGTLGAATTIWLQHTTVAENLDKPLVDRAIQVQDLGHQITLENSIIQGRCEVLVPPPGIYISLGGNVVNSRPGTALASTVLCANQTSDSAPRLLPTWLWGATATRPILTGAWPRYYDNATQAESIDHTTCPTAVTIDQRASPRPVGLGVCDAGSIEQ